MTLNFFPPGPAVVSSVVSSLRKSGAVVLGWLAGVMLAGAGFSAQAQWLTQTNVVKPGWTAVYLYVDPSSTSLDQLVASNSANPIVEVWMWKSPAGSAQYISTPQAPLNAGSQWLTWLRASGGTPNSLVTLVPNTAYLIHSTATTNFNWCVKGKPAPPSYSWDMTGLNLIGFPTPYANPPRFQDYLAPAPAVAGIVQLYQYIGGDFSSVNPGQVFSQFSTRVTRGQAFWMSATNIYNAYFGPFQITLPNPSGVNFGDSSSQFTLHLHNVTAGTLKVSVRLLPSETPPAGQTPIVGQPPVLIRGSLNSSNLTFSYVGLATNNSAFTTNTLTWTLPPMGQSGSDITVVLGVNRFALTNNPGSLYAGILQFTDSLGFSEVNVPVAAQSSTTAGLWVGAANITQVGSYLKSYATNADASMVVNSNGAYIVSSVNTNLGPVPAAYPLRLIVHNDGTNSHLLERVYFGQRQDTNVVIATTESVLDTAHLDIARRITATHLPWSAANVPWNFSGQLGLGGVLSTTVTTAYDDQTSNPFLHTYHPDHDNLDALFAHELPQGSQSYGVTRQITLNVAASGNDFGSLTLAGQNLSGTYQETITLAGLAGATRTFNVSGYFSLVRISPIATLTTH